MKGLAVLAIVLAGCMSFHEGPLPGAPRSQVDAYAELPGALVHYRDQGSGPAVVLVHGFASSLAVWEPVARRLAKAHRVISLDLKGFGWSDRREGDYSPAAQAALVLALMDRLGVEKAAIVGHSWGASVALALALAAPKRVTRLALYDAFVYEDQLPTTFLFARAGGLGEMIFGLHYSERADDKMALAFYDPANLSQALVDTVEDALERPGTTAAALAAVRGQRFEEMESRYRRVRKPTLLLWGREDRVTPLEYGERLANELPEAKLVVYPRCGHFPMIEAATPSTRDLVRFVARDLPKARKPPPAPVAPPPPPAEPVEPVEPPPPVEPSEPVVE